MTKIWTAPLLQILKTQTLPLPFVKGCSNYEVRLKAQKLWVQSKFVFPKVLILERYFKVIDKSIMVSKNAKKNCWQKFFAFLNAYSLTKVRYALRGHCFQWDIWKKIFRIFRIFEKHSIPRTTLLIHRTKHLFYIY